MVQGQFHDARSSVSAPASLEGAGGGNWLVRFADRQVLYAAAESRVSERIGSIPRRIHFPDGAEFESTDNEGIDALLGEEAVSSTFVHHLERRWGIALAALVGVAVAGVLLVVYGFPALAGWVAGTLPPSADRVIGAQALQILDAGFLDASELDSQRQAQLAGMFRRMTHDIDDGHEYRLEFRSSPRLGPNAFALPSGIIVLTDEIVQLSSHDEELMAVLAHEIGHVRGRHALRQMIQAAGISVAAVVLIGDVNSVTALAGAAPALLQARNSRDFEREADSFARDWLQRHDIPAERFDALLCRMEARFGGSGDPAGVFLASHPPTRERAHCTPEEETATP